jgi:hypothetical protein
MAAVVLLAVWLFLSNTTVLVGYQTATGHRPGRLVRLGHGRRPVAVP